VCLETIEHIENVQIIPQLVSRCQISNVIVSFPDKPTTAYNPFHKHDFVFQDVVDLFKGYLPYHSVRFVDSQSLLLMKLPAGTPWELFRNVRDL
jgi:hypothetical protein